MPDLIHFALSVPDSPIFWLVVVAVIFGHFMLSEASNPYPPGF